MNENISKEINTCKNNKEINTKDEHTLCFNSNKLLYIFAALALTVQRKTFYADIVNLNSPILYGIVHFTHQFVKFNIHVKKVV